MSEQQKEGKSSLYELCDDFSLSCYPETLQCTLDQYAKPFNAPQFLLHTLVVIILLLILCLFYGPCQPIIAFTTPVVYAEEPNPGVSNFSDEIDLSSGIDLGWSKNSTNQPQTSSPRYQPFVGSPPPRKEDIPIPMSTTSREKALAPVMIPATIVGTHAKLRDGPGLQYQVAMQLMQGTNIQVIGRSGEWVKIRTTDYAPTYWVASALINVSPSVLSTLYEVPASAISPSSLPTENNLPSQTENNPEENTSTPLLVATLNEEVVNLRSGPGMVYELVGQGGIGTSVQLIAQHHDWFETQFADGKTVWIFGELLDMDSSIASQVPQASDIPPPPEEASLYASGDVASYAIQFVGQPYAYGGTMLGGFDCSGFTQYVYGQYGVNLPRLAADQYNTAYGMSVDSINDLQPGDLVFFANTSDAGISHVAVYTGMGRIVHAITYDLGVGVSNIWDGYWVSHYYGAIRVRR